MISTDFPRSSSLRASRSTPKWSSIPSVRDSALPSSGRRQEKTVSRPRRNRHSFTALRRHSLNTRSLFLIFTFILLITGGLARPQVKEEKTTKATTSMERVTRTRPSPEATPIPDDGESNEDEEPIEEEDGEEEEGEEEEEVVDEEEVGDDVGNEGIEVDTPPVETPIFPKAFDTNIGTNFTTPTCPAFFSVFLEDPEFQNCLPLSAMIKDSKSFFDIIKQSAFKATRVLDAACSVDYGICAAKMEYYGREITLPDRCGQEFRDRNPLVTQAYAAFLSYKSLYFAGCLKSDEGSYCYVDAITNVTNPDDSHIYYLPLGLRLPGGSRPTCSSCAQDTMAEFAKFAGNKSEPLSDTYLSAAEQINIICGPQYVSTTVLVSRGVPLIPYFSSSFVGIASTVMAIMLFI